jgi:long-subunit acyl-CoA synthetase (AMP-forming)
LAHSFAKLIAYIGFFSPVRIAFFPAVIDRRSSRLDPNAILRDIRELGSEIVPVVPRFLEKMKEGIEAQATKQSLKSLLLRHALRAVQRHAAAISSGRLSFPRSSPSTTVS